MDVVKVRMSSEGGFPVNHELAGIVPMAVESEQAVLTANIKDKGQKIPIVLWQGGVVDGRCRQKALTQLGLHILYTELDSALTEEEVRVYVKAVNVRRNLTSSQKVATACKEYIGNTGNTVKTVAKSWGISERILNNALWIYREDSGVIDKVFNGGTVAILDSRGVLIESNRITAIYAHMKKTKEDVVEKADHSWSEDGYIKTQAGKSWYYEQRGYVGNSAYMRMMLAELANYKFVEDT